MYYIDRHTDANHNYQYRNDPDLWMRLLVQPDV
jgi:hypothetical protein